VRRSQRAVRCTSSSVTEILPITKAMYLLIIALMPILFLFNPRLALAGLVAAIVWMYVQRTKPRRPAPKRPTDSDYEAGYK